MGEGEYRQITGSISIEVNIVSENPCLQLNYKTNDKPINYQVSLVSIPSNIGAGIVWYFVCPNTGKHCRKLYLADTRFLHREAFKGCYYEKQTQSHKSRKFHNSFKKFFDADELYELIYKKHFKSIYAGKPTKRYQKLMKQIKAAKQFSEVKYQVLSEANLTKVVCQ